MHAFFCLFVWAAMWVWVVKKRASWHLIPAHLAGAGSGLAVALAVSAILAALFPSSVSKPVTNLGPSLVAMLTILGALAGAWMWIVSRPRPESLVARHLLGCLCGLLAGTTMLTIIAINFR